MSDRARARAPGDLIGSLTGPPTIEERRLWEAQHALVRAEGERLRELDERAERAGDLRPEYAEAYLELRDILPELEQAAQEGWSDHEVRSLVGDFLERERSSSTSPERLRNAAIAYVVGRRSDAMADSQVAAESPTSAASPTPRRRGRPKGSHDYDRNRLIAEYQRVKKVTGRAPTQEQFCGAANPTMSRSTLGRHLRAFALAWPPE